MVGPATRRPMMAGIKIPAKSERWDACGHPGKLFIGGITRHTTTKQLRDHFSRYGRVLDCVAMRQPDGRPRGFGYVTLDSPAVADRCLAEQQIIDGRHVEMKRAVPEISSAVAGSKLGVAFEQGQDCMGTPSMRTPHLPIYTWPDSPSTPLHPTGQTGSRLLTSASPTSLAGQLWSWSGTLLQKGDDKALDCVELLTGMPRWESLPPAETAMPISPHRGSPPAFQPPAAAGTPGTLSANAAEFVPAVKDLAMGGLSASTPSAQRNRTPLGELTNITNIINNSRNAGDVREPVKADPRKQISRGAAGLCAGSENRPSPNSEAENDAFFGKPILQRDSKEEEEYQGSMNDSGSSTSDPGLPLTLGPRHLPSMGSAEHAMGTCKRCNFFPKGRCQNGASCTFCHFPHDKPKPSRQEKRDRRTAWLSHREGRDEGMDADDLAQRTLAYSVLPGMPPIRSVKLPGPLPLPGNGDRCDAVQLGFPCQPPGLPHPKSVGAKWQADEEVSPLRFGVPSPSNRQLCSVLATVPLAAPMERPMGTTPISPTVKETSTVATQTHEDMDYACPRCCKAQAAPADHCRGVNQAVGSKVTRTRRGRTWKREELLKLRATMRRIGSSCNTIKFSTVAAKDLKDPESK